MRDQTVKITLEGAVWHFGKKAYVKKKLVEIKAVTHFYTLVPVKLKQTFDLLASLRDAVGQI